MQSHVWARETGLDVRVSRGVTTLRENNCTRPAGEAPVNFRAPVDDKQYIRSILFGGFHKCLYQVQKFDSGPEWRFAVILENDEAVEKWFKPAKSQFQIFCRHAHQEFPYEPDFAGKPRPKSCCASRRWCKHATEPARTLGGKPWSYLPIPHDAITASATLDGLIAAFRAAAPSRGTLKRREAVTEHEKMEFRNSLARLYDDSLALKEATTKLADAARELHHVANAHERRLDKIEVVHQWLPEKERARETGEQA